MKFTATAIAALFAFGASQAMATSDEKPGGVKAAISNVTTTYDLTGNVEVTLDKSFVIDGTGGLNLRNVEVIADREIKVNVPATVDNAVEFSQGNWGHVTAKKIIVTDGVDDMVVSATAAANIATVDVDGSLSLEASQVNDGAVTATVDTTQWHAGDVDVTATAIGNLISATATGDGIFDVSQNNEGNVYAAVDAEIYGRGIGEVNTAATAIGNSFSLELDGVAIGSIDQMNTGNVTAINDDIIHTRKDPATATAIANAISITRSVIE